MTTVHLSLAISLKWKHLLALMMLNSRQRYNDNLKSLFPRCFKGCIPLFMLAHLQPPNDGNLQRYFIPLNNQVGQPSLVTTKGAWTVQIYESIPN